MQSQAGRLQENERVKGVGSEINQTQLFTLVSEDSIEEVSSKKFEMINGTFKIVLRTSTP